MRYFYGTWDHDLSDDPDWMHYEVDDGTVTRMIEHFKDGRVERKQLGRDGVLVDQDFRPETWDLRDPTMTLSETTPAVFEDRWNSQHVIGARP